MEIDYERNKVGSPRGMTDVLVAALEKAGVAIKRVDKSTKYGDSDGIYLSDDQALFVDYEAYPVICVSLDDLMPVGGNCLIEDWQIEEGGTVDHIVTVTNRRISRLK